VNGCCVDKHEIHNGKAQGKSIFSAGFRELMDTRLGKEESAAADRML
jgi:hypothetical protein